MRRALLALPILLALSCRRSPDATQEEPSPEAPGSSRRFAGKTTAELVKRPEIAALVDALAAEKAIESSHVGAAGAPSRAYENYRALQAKATADEMAALVEHESPVVRGYVGQHLAHSGPLRVAAIVALAGDDTTVKTLNGCMGGGGSVGMIVQEALCGSLLSEAGAALVAIHDRGGPGASHALACAAPSAPGASGEAAARALRKGGLSPHDEAAYLRALSIRPPADGCDLALRGARSAEASVQIGAAQALGKCGDDASRRALEELAAGKNVVVARHAKASLFLLIPGRRDALAGEHEVIAEVGDRLANALRSAEGTREAIALVETLANQHPYDLGAPFHRAVESADTTAAARRLVAGLEPSKKPRWGSVRGGVIAYLGRVLDRESLPELRRSLASGDTGEILSALRALEALRDKTARPAVEKLTTHADAAVAKAAKQAAAAL